MGIIWLATVSLLYCWEILLNCSAKESLTWGDESVDRAKNIGMYVGFMEDGNSAMMHELDWMLTDLTSGSGSLSRFSSTGPA